MELKPHLERKSRKQHEQLRITEKFELPTDLKDERVSKSNPAIKADQIDAFDDLESTFDKDGHIITIVGHMTRDGEIELQLMMDGGELTHEKLHLMKQRRPLPTADYLINNVPCSLSNSR